MPTLWLKFSDEISLPTPLTPEEEDRLEDIYDAMKPGSVLSRALALLGMASPGEAMLRWHHGYPYINWSRFVDTVSCGWIVVQPSAAGQFAYAPRNNLMNTFALLKSQWKTERYVARTTGYHADDAHLLRGIDDRLVESTALGLALQALLLRLPKHTPQDFAGWLADPGAAPLAVRKTVMQVQAIQKHRTLLSPAWAELFPPRREPAHSLPAPDWFWDEPPPAEARPDPVVGNPDVTAWQGLPVCAGQVSGRAILMRSLESSVSALEPSDFPILVFPRARPETVEAFGPAAALLFAEGGALSHACTVAREQGIPCITALGPEFLDALEKRLHNGKVWLSIDGAAGHVRVLPTG